MIKTTKKEFVCSECQEDKINLAIVESQEKKQDICWDCAFAVKRHETYFNAGMSDQFYSEGN